MCLNCIANDWRFHIIRGSDVIRIQRGDSLFKENPDELRPRKNTLWRFHPLTQAPTFRTRLLLTRKSYVRCTVSPNVLLQCKSLLLAELAEQVLILTLSANRRLSDSWVFNVEFSICLKAKMTTLNKHQLLIQHQYLYNLDTEDSTFFHKPPKLQIAQF